MPRYTPRYAENTRVPVDRSTAEIEALLRRHGATQFMRTWDADMEAVIGFVLRDRAIRFVLPIPARDEFGITPTGRTRKGAAVDDAWNQEHRRRWRALALVLKAKLEAVESGIVAFEEEFLAHIVVPGTGRTVGQRILPELAETYRTGKLPPLLPSSCG